MLEGSFILNGKPLTMTARQILAPPARGFVRQAQVGPGLMRFAGSDGYHRSQGVEESWTKFWLRGLIPLARTGGTDDHARAATTRVMMEAIWTPASLLPRFGAEWVQTGPDSAERSTSPMPPVLRRYTSPSMRKAIWLRPSRCAGPTPTPEKTFRLQPFGGRMLETDSIRASASPSGPRWATCSAPLTMRPSSWPRSPAPSFDMIARAVAPALLRLSDAAAVLTPAAVAAALLLPDACAAVPDHLRPGAWSQNTISTPTALALLAVNARLRQCWAKGWLIWAGMVVYLIYAYALYNFDQVKNPAWLLYLAVLSLSVSAALMFMRAVDPGAVKVGPRPPPRRAVPALFGLPLVLFVGLWLSMLAPAMAARMPLPGHTIFMLDLAFAFLLTGLSAWLLWRGRPVGDLVAIPMLMKVAVLGFSVFLRTFYTWALFDGPFLTFDLMLYA